MWVSWLEYAVILHFYLIITTKYCGLYKVNFLIFSLSFPRISTNIQLTSYNFELDITNLKCVVKLLEYTTFLQCYAIITTKYYVTVDSRYILIIKLSFKYTIPVKYNNKGTKTVNLI